MKTKKWLGFLFVAAITASVAGTAQASLVAYYPFEGNANDASGHGRHGTVYGAALTGGHNGGQAYSFDGLNDYVSIPLDIDPAVYSSLTMGAWAKASGNGWAAGGKVISHDDGGFDRTMGLDHRAGTAPVYHWGAFTGSGVLAGPAYNQTGWDFVAAVYEPGKTTLYVNGATYSASSTPGSSVYTYTCIGTNLQYSEFFRGIIDDVFFFNEALSKAQLDTMMAAGHPVPLPGPLLLLGSGIAGLIGFSARRRR